MTVNLSPTQLEKFHNLLRDGLAGDVLVDPYQRALYGTDASLYQIQPLAVVVPRDQADVVRTVQLAAEFAVPIVPRGSGTSLSGQSIGRGVVLDFSKYMNRILQIDPQGQTARVEAGVVLDHLNAAAAEHALQFGPEVATSSRANLGGMIGNNSAGARSILHGKVVDHVISLDVVLADGSVCTLGPDSAACVAQRQAQTDLLGQVYREIPRIVAEHRQEIIDRFPKVLRRVSGYNLDEFVPECRQGVAWPPTAERSRMAQRQRWPDAVINLARLVVGAEGTLGVVTAALLHLVPQPRHRGIIVLQFDSFRDSVAMVGRILDTGPSAVEMFDGLILRLADQNLEYRHYLDFVQGRPESVLIAEFSADDADEVRRRAADLVARMRSEPTVSHIIEALDPRLCSHIWACRKAALPLLMSIPGDRKPIAFVEDTAVTIDVLPEFSARFREILHRHGTDGAFYGHASVGCLHIRPLIDAASRDDLARLERISNDVADLVIEFRGAMSGEHGDGLARSFLNERLFGPRLYQAFKQVKAAFDPAGLMNPGKIVDGPSPIENLRYGADYRRLPLATALDFSREGGIARAAEACNGSGLCRKTRSGTMCPSFMVTGDEEHSTRGRANALRLVLSGALPAAELSGQKLYGTFDLCLQCKGCKAECPSNVDVAKLKVEFLHQYHQQHGIALGTRMMAHVATLNRLGSALAPLSNWLAAAPGAAWLGEKLLGIDRRRPMPQFARRHFRRWFAQRSAQRGPGPAPRGPVVLLDDCLTSYCEPSVNRAAVAVLEAAGYEVHLAGIDCCGRAMLSKGLVEPARRLARDNVARLAPWAERGAPIVGCEPSCLLTLVDEYRDLVPGDATRLVAARARLIDTHLAQEAVELPLSPQRRDVLVHGHCHQKALVGLRDLQTVLKRVEGAAVRMLDSGCCGMAGSFGYEHYDLSMRIGRRILFPAIEQAPEAVVLAPGFSCRHQIAHATGRHAMHPVEWLAGRLSGQQGA